MEDSINSINKGLSDREDPNNQRESKVKKLEELRKSVAAKREKVNVYLRCDEGKVEEMKQRVYIAREGWNRWADNVYVVKDWMNKARPDLTLREMIIGFPIVGKISFMV